MVKVTSTMKFRDFKSHSQSSKMWIDPKDRPIPLNGMHYEWLIENAPMIRKIFKLPMPDWSFKDEVPARLWALKNGFTRVNYKNGMVVFETNKAFWSKKRQAVITKIIADNADDIDSIVVNVLNDDGSVFKDGEADVHKLDGVAAKVNAIPVISRTTKSLIAEVYHRANKDLLRRVDEIITGLK